MNRAQTIAVWVGIVLVVLMGVFPPWNRVSEAPAYHLERSAGYAPVFLPPLSLLRYSHIRLNVRRLLVQWGAVVIATIALVRALRDEDEHEARPTRPGDGGFQR